MAWLSRISSASLRLEAMWGVALAREMVFLEPSEYFAHHQQPVHCNSYLVNYSEILHSAVVRL